MHQTDKEPEETEEATLRKSLMVLGVGGMAVIAATIGSDHLQLGMEFEASLCYERPS